MREQDRELMLILMEECAEVQQAISKVFRFGLDTSHKDFSNRDRLEEEVGDLLCCIELLVQYGIIDQSKVNLAKYNKVLKLRRWSSLDIKENK